MPRQHEDAALRRPLQRRPPPRLDHRQGRAGGHRRCRRQYPAAALSKAGRTPTAPRRHAPLRKRRSPKRPSISPSNPMHRYGRRSSAASCCRHPPSGSHALAGSRICRATPKAPGGFRMLPQHFPRVCWATSADLSCRSLRCPRRQDGRTRLRRRACDRGGFFSGPPAPVGREFGASQPESRRRRGRRRHLGPWPPVRRRPS